MAISGKGEGKAKGAAKSVPARPASERPVRLVDDLHCDDNMRRAARFTIRASRASRKFLQRSISGRIGSKSQRYVRLVAAAACGCVSDVFWGTAMLISRQFMAPF